MEDTENNMETNVMDFAEWNERLRKQRALEEAQKVALDEERRMNLLLREFRC
jgi:hypothetical protein